MIKKYQVYLDIIFDKMWGYTKINLEKLPAPEINLCRHEMMINQEGTHIYFHTAIAHLLSSPS